MVCEFLGCDYVVISSLSVSSSAKACFRCDATIQQTSALALEASSLLIRSWPATANWRLPGKRTESCL